MNTKIPTEKLGLGRWYVWMERHQKPRNSARLSNRAKGEGGFADVHSRGGGSVFVEEASKVAGRGGCG